MHPHEKYIKVGNKSRFSRLRLANYHIYQKRRPLLIAFRCEISPQEITARLAEAVIMVRMCCIWLDYQSLWYIGLYINLLYAERSCRKDAITAGEYFTNLAMPEYRSERRKENQYEYEIRRDGEFFIKSTRLMSNDGHTPELLERKRTDRCHSRSYYFTV